MPGGALALERGGPKIFGHAGHEGVEVMNMNVDGHAALEVAKASKF